METQLDGIKAVSPLGAGAPLRQEEEDQILDQLLQRKAERERPDQLSSKNLFPDARAGVYQAIDSCSYSGRTHTKLSKPLPGRPYVEVATEFQPLACSKDSTIELCGGDSIIEEWLAKHWRGPLTEQEIATAPPTAQEIARRAPLVKRAKNAKEIVVGQERRRGGLEADLLEKQLQIQEAERVLAGFKSNAAAAADALRAFDAERGDPDEVAARFSVAAKPVPGPKKAADPGPFVNRAGSIEPAPIEHVRIGQF
jgi:hypothetical protein